MKQAPCVLEKRLALRVELLAELLLGYLLLLETVVLLLNPSNSPLLQKLCDFLRFRHFHSCVHQHLCQHQEQQSFPLLESTWLFLLRLEHYRTQIGYAESHCDRIQRSPALSGRLQRGALWQVSAGYPDQR